MHDGVDRQGDILLQKTCVAVSILQTIMHGATLSNTPKNPRNACWVNTVTASSVSGSQSALSMAAT